MTVENLMLLVGAVLSLVFTYTPKLNVWFAKWEDDYKRLFMVGVLALTAVALVGLSCAGLKELPYVAAVTCDRAGIIQMVEVFVLALLSNQGIDRVMPKPKQVKLADALSDAKPGV